MTLAEFADLAEVLSALGVIAGLIFVGVQMRQNTVQLRGAARSVANAESSAIRQAIFKDAEFAELVSAWTRQTRPLTAVEAERVRVFLFEIGFQLVQFWDRTKEGLFSREAEFNKLSPLYTPYLTTPLGLEWWQVARTVYQPDFVAALECVIPELREPAG